MVAQFDLPGGDGFGSHAHDAHHQLAWARQGVVVVRVADGTWVLPPTRALWIPAGLAHEVLADGRSTLIGVYFDADATPTRWTEPTPVAVGPLTAALLDHLARPLPPVERQRAEAVLHDTLEADSIHTLLVPLPADDRTARIAAGLLDNPADPCTLSGWGHRVGASGRTIARTIERETGMGFARWRTQVRMLAAIRHLAAGHTVTQTAGHVGYATSSAFIAAFRRSTGSTPGAYFA